MYLAGELTFHLLVLLKRCRVPYSPALALAPLAAALVLLGARHSAASDGTIGRVELATARADVLNTLGAVVAKLQPPLLAGAPFGLTPAGTPSAA